MVDFWVYDVIFLALFSIFVGFFLKNQKRNLSREGIIFMYRTQVGVNAINWVGDNFKKLLHSIKYLIVGVGLLLMGVMVWMLGQTLMIYILRPEITQLIKAPPIAPLIPYFPKLFGMESFFPPFYFTYFIVALAIVAIVHEFSHGIYMKLFKVKIKSTGLVFLGPILGAFVEEEKTGFTKKKNLEQMTILAAGVFANIVFALLFYGLYVAFFFMSFSASGYMFTNYAMTSVPLENISGFEDSGNLTKVFVDGNTYYLDQGLAIQLTLEGLKELVVYSDAPAIKAEMKGIITMANNIKIKNHDDLRLFLLTKNPGDEVTFTTETNDGEKKYDLILGVHPEDSNLGYVGIGHHEPQPRGFVQNFFAKFMSFKESSTYYKPSWDGDFVYFIYHFLWWIMIINLLVALFNMLPLGMLDGGRFFYLTILSITRSEKFAKRLYDTLGYAILFVFVLLMFFWFIRIV